MATFRDKLRSELNEAQNRRVDLVKHKLAFITSATGLGSLKIGEVDTSLLLYIAPLIALTYDLYITGEDFGIKRAGAFLGRAKSPAETEERLWEWFASENRDTFSVIAGPLPSILTVAAAVVILYVKNTLQVLDLVWFGFYYVLFLGLAIFGQHRNRKLLISANGKPSPDPLSNSDTRDSALDPPLSV